VVVSAIHDCVATSTCCDHMSNRFDVGSKGDVTGDERVDNSQRTRLIINECTLRWGCVHLCRVEAWKVTLCDPVWQVTLRSCEMSSINSYTLPLPLPLPLCTLQLQ